MALWDDTSITAFIRDLIDEDTAKHWTTAAVTRAKNAAMVLVGAKYWYLLFPMYKTFEDSAMTDGTNTIALPTDAQPNTVCVTVASTGRKIRHIQENELFKFEHWDDGKPVVWLWKGGAVYLVPTPSETTAGYFRIWYMEYRNSVADFPEELRPLVAIEAAILALVKDQNTQALQGLFALQKQYHDTALIALHLSSIQEPSMIGDYEESDSYTMQLEE